MSWKRRRSARDIKKELRAIYSGVDGKLPDLTHLSHNKQSAFTKFLIRAIIVLAVLSFVSWAGFFLFANGLFEEDETLNVKIETQDEIKSGEETTFVIRYENNGNVPIASINLKLNLPTNFHLTSAIPPATEETQWTIGSLTAGSDGAITIKGVFLSEIPSTQRIQALFTYKPANFSSDFQEIENKTIEIEKSAVEMTMAGPDKALAGDSVTYTLNIRHTGKEPVYNLRLIPVFPSDFSLSSSKPELPKDQTYFEIASLEPGKLMEVSWTGAFTSSASGEMPVAARLGFMDEENFFEQTKTEVKTDVLGGAVSFHLIINGSDKNQTIETGQTLRGSIDFKNPGTESVEGITFVMKIDSSAEAPIDWSKAILFDGKRDGTTVNWDKKTTPALSKLEPGKNSVIDFTLPIVSSLSSKHADQFTISLLMNVEKVGSTTSSRTIEATPIVVSVNTNLRITSEAKYSSGELPPKAGKTTTYRIFWNLSNSLHELENVEVSTILPQDVSWKENSTNDTGTLVFNSTTRQVRWQIPKLTTDVKNTKSWFDVSITPTQTDVGKSVKLANQTTLEAVDSVTKSEVNTSLPVLTTEPIN